MTTTDEIMTLSKMAAERMQYLVVGSAEWTRMSKIAEAAEMVAAFDLETSKWIACLRCPMAFKTEREYSAHSWSTHR